MAYGVGSIRESNISIFRDTSEKMENNPSLKESIKKATDGQEVILEDTAVECDLSRFSAPAKVFVTRSSSFDAAREYTSNKVCVLNFASATTPGGGVVKGSSAQEECLCRCSTLYKSLIDPDCFKKFYEPHKNGLSPLHNDDIIYTPNVVIFKEDSYKDLPKEDWVTVDVLTCAAPNLRSNPNNAFNEESTYTQVSIPDNELYELHVKRARKILQVAAAKGCDTIILGAFGCGAFRNDPQVVAKAYKDTLPAFRHAFKNIEFAVYCRPSDDTNYRVFEQVIRG